MLDASRRQLPDTADQTRDIRNFLVHVAAFAAVNAVIWGEDMAAGVDVDWAFCVTVPWGAGLLVHATALVFSLRR